MPCILETLSYSVACLQNMGAQAALQAAQSMTSTGGVTGSTGGTVGGMEGEPKTVLRVIVEHMLYPVTIDILKQVCNASLQRRIEHVCGCQQCGSCRTQTIIESTLHLA